MSGQVLQMALRSVGRAAITSAAIDRRHRARRSFEYDGDGLYVAPAPGPKGGTPAADIEWVRARRREEAAREGGRR